MTQLTIDDLKRRIVMLRDALGYCAGALEDLHGGSNPGNFEEIFYSTEAALAATSTQADVAAWEKSKRDAALEEVIETLSNCQFITDDPRRDQRDYAMFLSTKKLCVEGVKRLKDKP